MRHVQKRTCDCARVTALCYERLRGPATNLVNLGITLVLGETSTQPTRHQVTVGELQVLVNASVSLAPAKSLVMVDLPVGLDAFVHYFMCRVPGE